MENIPSAAQRRIARQWLESLQLAGVEQMPHPSFIEISAMPEPTAATAPVVGHAAPSEIAAPSVRLDAPLEPPRSTNSLPLAAALSQTELAMPPKAKPAATKTAAKPVKLSLAAKKEQLATLCEQVKSCQLCPSLVANRSQTVFGVGNPNTRLCFFGEAPGADEDRQGEPFVGRAGQLLDRIVEACTLKRRDIYILNTVKCRPPQNRNPEPEEIDNCRSFFEQQLELIRPEFICCLGLVSAKALLGTTQSVGQLRGKLHPWRWAQVLVTYHPAYLLRNPPAKKEVWKDMQFLMKEMGIELA